MKLNRNVQRISAADLHWQSVKLFWVYKNVLLKERFGKIVSENQSISKRGNKIGDDGTKSPHSPITEISSS